MRGCAIITRMPLFLPRLIRRLAARINWFLPVALILFVFVTSWPLMALAEEPGSDIAQPSNYWWWFLITATTVGYGDYFPKSTGGHLVGGYVIVGGIVTATILFTRLAASIDNARGRRMLGSVKLDVSGQIVVLGYSPGRTERILDEVLADGEREVVLGAWDETEKHPIADRDVDFVRGDLTDESVLRRACVERAHSLLIDARDDNEALAVLVTVHHLNPGAHIVVALRDMERASRLRYIADTVRCVQWDQPHMLAEELLDPGITGVYADLMTRGGSNTYSVRLPDSLGQTDFGRCQVALGQRHDATVLAMNSGEELLVSPPWSTPVTPGMVLYYVASSRLTPDQVVSSIRHP